MRIRVIDRLLNLLAGLILLALTAALAAEAFLGWQISARVGAVLGKHDTVSLVIVAAVALALFSLGAYCVGTLFRRDKSRRGFVVQKTEGGELSISVKAIESLVRKCLDKHDEIHLTGMRLDTTRDGLVIRLRIGLAGGVNIPLAVGAVQKQIKQYVTACSGVDVKEVKVQVETSAEQAGNSIYTVPDMPENSAALPREEEIPREAAPAEGKEEKCLHQRLFGSEEQENLVPAPPVPELTVEDAARAEAAEEPQAAEAADAPADVTEEENHEIAQ